METDRLLAAKKKFSRLLKEIFQFDCADLDFGIYRILAMRRAQLEKFLDDDLLPQVEGILISAAGDRRLASSPDVAVLAREVFSDLTTFFARYYDEGDFMALPRYKGDTYAIPYDGSEVKLHWANADQYYIKTSEQHAGYTAVLDGVAGLDKPRLRFRLAAADDDRDNNKSSEKRRYVLRATDAVELQGHELTVWFEYRVPEAGTGRQPAQSAVCEAAEKAILAAVPSPWLAVLSKKAPQSPEKYTTLGYQLYRYTKKSTSDYFIHKDLGGFLRRELDFFIKNEVLFLDDLEGRSSADIDSALQKVRAIRAVGRKIVDWLAQMEDFQKRLWKKRKFVVGSSWLVSLALVPKEFYAEIASNERQRSAWVAEFGIDSNSEPLTNEFLAGQPHLPLDTALFEKGFERRLLSALGSAVTEPDGLLVHGDNYHALRLFRPLLAGQVDCIFIDPPYNTGNDGFLYKDEYGHSSWLAMMNDRIRAGVALLRSTGAFFQTIDHRESARSRLLLDDVFFGGVFLADIAWQRKYSVSNNAKGIAPMTDRILSYAASDKFEVCLFPRSEEATDRYQNLDNDARGPWKPVDYWNQVSPEERPNLVYPITNPHTGLVVAPDKKAWKYSKDEHERHVRESRIYWGKDGTNTVPALKRFLSEVRDGVVPWDFWTWEFGGHTDAAKKDLEGIVGGSAFETPKPTTLIERCVMLTLRDRPGVVLDFFAGTGTTGHAVFRMNHADGIKRRFVLVDSGDYFDSVLVTRVRRALRSAEWKDGSVASDCPTVGIVKIVRLESYDDTLENIALTAPAVGDLFERNASLRADYNLRYMLNLEAEGSLLNLERFRKPWDFTIKMRRAGVVQDSPVDLVETFNCLIGLRARRYDSFGQDGLLFVLGTVPDGRRVLVVWRDCELWPNDKLEQRCRQAFESFGPGAFDLVYVNGDNHLLNIKTGEQAWKVNLIEETFHARMFDTSDVE